MTTKSKTIDWGGNKLIVAQLLLAAKSGQPGTTVTLSSAELGVLDAVTAGTVAASKAVVVDSNLDITSFRNLTATNLKAGLSGTAGTVDVFPTTASKGKLEITCTDQTGDTTVTVTAGAMAAARTITLPDPGAAASFVLSTGTSTATSATSTELTQLAGSSSTPTASKAVIATASGWQAIRRPVVEDGANVVLTAADSGALCIFDKVDGALFTLPTPAIGLTYDFIVTASVTSNSMKVITNTGTVFIEGTVDMVDTDTTFTHTAQTGNGSSHIAVLMASASTNSTGGILGTRFNLTCRTATKWTISGQINHAGTVSTPFSAS